MSDRFDISFGEHLTRFTAMDEGIVFREGEIVANRFKVVEVIGGEGMGLVYKVEDQLLGSELKAINVEIGPAPFRCA